MNLRNEILKEHTKSNTLQIAEWAGDNPVRVRALVTLFLEDEYRVAQRTAWILNTVAEKHPAIVTPHLEAMVSKMQEPGVPVAVKRNVIRMLQFLDIPEPIHGPVMQICFDWLADPGETVAVRCFSMTVLAKLARIYPEIVQELRLVIEDELGREPTAGFKARARRVFSDDVFNYAVNN